MKGRIGAVIRSVSGCSRDLGFPEVDLGEMFEASGICDPFD